MTPTQLVELTLMLELRLRSSPADCEIASIFASRKFRMSRIT